MPEASTTPTYILGISAFYHDSAAALTLNGHIVAAAQEERFTLVRHDAAFPINAISWCLQHAGITLNEVAFVTFYDKPLLKFERLLETYKAFAPRGLESFLNTTSGWLDEKLFQKQMMVQELSYIMPNFPKSRLLFAQHHLSHAASAFYPSPYDNAVVLVLDGIGEWATTTVAIGSPDNLEVIREIHFPHSLGLLYSAFTAYTGHRVNTDESRLMNLAAYGKPLYADIIRRNLVHVKPDGSYRLNMDYFDFTGGPAITNARFNKLFGGPPRKQGSAPTQREMDLAASIQKVLEDIVLRMATSLAKEFPHIPNLCLAGEVALNCVATSKLLTDAGTFKNVWIQPAASDCGGAIGAAMCAWYQHLRQPLLPKTRGDLMQAALLGPAYTNKQVEDVFDRIGAIYRPIKTEGELLDRTTAALTEGKVIGWFQGRAEFGDRALGARSILGDPRNPAIVNKPDLQARFAQSYRPFAASIPREDMADWVDTVTDSPYMLLTAGILKKHYRKGGAKALGPHTTIPAVTHVDGSVRVQTVSQEINPRFHLLLKEFQHLTGCPILANTALRNNNQPLVNTPEDAFRCFMSTELDMLVIENNILYKEEQNPTLFPAYQTKLSRG